MYSEAQKRAIYKWRIANKSKHNEVRMKSYYHLKGMKDAFRDLCKLTELF